MTQGPSLRKPETLVEPTPQRPLPPAAHRRLLDLERLVAAIEDELSDSELDDEQTLQNIGERVAQVNDGR